MEDTIVCSRQKSDPGNFAPVSLTCVYSVARGALVNYFVENRMYIECQHGFRDKRSCLTVAKSNGGYNFNIG